jgi:hypothetical protein
MLIFANDPQVVCCGGVWLPRPCRHGHFTHQRSCRFAALARSFRPNALLFEDTPAHGRPGPFHQRSHRNVLAVVTPRLLSHSSFKDCLSIDRPVRPLRTEARAAALPALQRVPLLPFLTTSAVSSAQAVVGLLHPTTDHEVHPVSGRTTTVADATTLLTDAVTLRSFSLPAWWKPVTR